MVLYSFDNTFATLWTYVFMDFIYAYNKIYCFIIYDTFSTCKYTFDISFVL